jgi:glutamate dehydrogenase
MPALNDAIGELDAKVPGKVQLRLYAAIEDLLRDRLVWFCEMSICPTDSRASSNIIATASPHFRRRSTARCRRRPRWRVPRGAELQGAGVPEALARLIADLPELAAAPDIVLVADRTKKPVAEVAATYFAVQAFFRLERIVSAARAITVSDYFDRLALDRAVDSIGDAERLLTAAMSETNVSGAAAVEAWIAPRKAEVERIRAAIHTIAGSGLTLSKLAVAASLLSDLAKIN